MPKLTKEFIEGIQQIPVEELQRFVIKAARKDKALFDLLNLEYLKKEDATEELFEATKNKITGHLINVSLRGPVQRSCAAAISKAVNEINYFAQVTKDKYREAQLLNILLDDVFEEYLMIWEPAGQSWIQNLG
ncbi:MAG: hypothetical protein ACNA7V_14755 [Bacteroidales bacterium]